MINWWSSASKLSGRLISIDVLTLILNSVDLETLSVYQVSTLMSKCFVVCQCLPNYQLHQCPLLNYQKISTFHQDQQKDKIKYKIYSIRQKCSYKFEKKNLKEKKMILFWGDSFYNFKKKILFFYEGYFCYWRTLTQLIV
jgi:hypothetical protein